LLCLELGRLATELRDRARSHKHNVSGGDERVVARAPARPRRRLEVALVVRARRGDLSNAAARLALALDLDAFRGRWCRGPPTRRRPPRRLFGAPRVGRRGARDGALRVLGRAEIRLGAVGAQFLDDVCDFALVLGMAASGAHAARRYCSWSPVIDGTTKRAVAAALQPAAL
ncbi:unnamed protein product, partial [Pelagomonas calceolata]